MQGFFDAPAGALAVAATAVLAMAAPAQAQGQTLVNGSFESYFDGWSARGDAAVDDTLVSHGEVGMLLSSASANDIDDPLVGLGPGGANFSGESAVPVAGAGGLLEGLGIAASGLDLGSRAATEGSALWQTIDVKAGDRLSFDWAFATIDPRIGDYAFVTFDGAVQALADLRAVSVFDNGIAFSPPANFSRTFMLAGRLTLGFGVVDIDDELGTSVLLLDNVQLTAAVPEPGSWSLMLGGLALLLRRARARIR